MTTADAANPAESTSQTFVYARTHLWRRRLFEGEAGLTRFVVEARAGAHMEKLLSVKHDIFDCLPQDEDDETAWKAAFFRAQALMEAFVVNSFGHDALAQWAASNSAVYARIDGAPKDCAPVPLERLNDQAALYGSDTRWKEREPDRAILEIPRCAIWEYREKARRRGVTITLDAPCEYCVPATTAMITNKGLNASHQLTANSDARGCIWTASRSPLRESATAPTESDGDDST